MGRTSASGAAPMGCFFGTRCWARLAAEDVAALGAEIVRFFLIVVGLAVAALAGLFIYGQLLEPDTRMIEQEAVSAGNS